MQTVDIVKLSFGSENVLKADKNADFETFFQLSISFGLSEESDRETVKAIWNEVLNLRIVDKK
jgi:hypothetical protein